MFANKSNTTSNRKRDETTSSIKAFLGAGSEFEGRMTFNENMQIDGTFRGEIVSEDLLVIGESGSLKAEVTVGSMIICGSFQGEINAKSYVKLKAPACVVGEIIAPSISIEEGVVFNGSIKMSMQTHLSQALAEPRSTNTLEQANSLVDKDSLSSVG